VCVNLTEWISDRNEARGVGSAQWLIAVRVMQETVLSLQGLVTCASPCVCCICFHTFVHSILSQRLHVLAPHTMSCKRPLAACHVMWAPCGYLLLLLASRRTTVGDPSHCALTLTLLSHSLPKRLLQQLQFDFIFVTSRLVLPFPLLRLSPSPSPSACHLRLQVRVWPLGGGDIALV